MNSPLILNDPSGEQAGFDIFLVINTAIDGFGRFLTDVADGSSSKRNTSNATQSCYNGSCVSRNGFAERLSSSDPLQNANYRRFQRKLDTYPEADSKIIGNQGAPLDAVLQQATDSYEAARKIGETGLALQMIHLTAMSSIAAISSPSTVTTKPGFLSSPNRIYSSEVLRGGSGKDLGPMHQFPLTFDKSIFKGTRIFTPNFFSKPKTGLTNDNLLFTRPGNINGKNGTFEIGTRPSKSGKTEVIVHRFFRPEIKK